jgi:hypothetical protein
LTRKNKCEPLNKDIPIKSIAESYGITICSTEIIGVIQSVIRTPLSDTLSNNSTQLYECQYCNKSFTHRSNKSRHEKSRCKKRNYNSQINDTDNKTYTQEEVNNIKEKAEQKIEEKIKEAKKEAEDKIKEVEEKIEEKVEILADGKAQKMVLCLVDKLIPNQTNCHNMNTVNNTQNNNNNNNLKINNFGKEKTKYITDTKLKIMFVDPRNVVIQHIKDTHYHVLHPENYNAKITNYNSKHMKVYEENEWKTVNKKRTVCSMYTKHEKIVDTEFERLKPELSDKVRNNYDEYKQSTIHCYNTFRQRLVDTEAAIITGTKRQQNIDLLRKDEVARLAKEQNKTPSEIFAEHMPDIFAEREDE